MIPDPAIRPTMSIEEAGAALSLGRSAAYEAARRGELPTLTFGRRKVVITAALRRMVALDEPDEHPAAAAPHAVIPAPAGVVVPFAGHSRRETSP